MATLFNTKISNTYQGLLKTSTNLALDGTLTQIQDGTGQDSNVKINNLGDIELNKLRFTKLEDSNAVEINDFLVSSEPFVAAANTKIPTVESVKNYVDDNVTAQDLDFSGNTGTGDVDLDSEVFTITGSNGIETTALDASLIIDGSILETDISTNATNITSNTNEIAANVGAISLNFNDIATNTQQISDLEDETQDIQEDVQIINNTAEFLVNKGQPSGYVPLDANSKILETYLPASIIGQLNYVGTWDATNDTPTLPNPTTVNGDYYIVSVAGTYLGVSYGIGDWIVSNGIAWEKIDNTESVSTVFGRLGNILANSTDYDAFYLLNTTDTFTGDLTVIGDVTLDGLYLSDDDRNVWIGYEAGLDSLSKNSNNVALGYQSLTSNTIGVNNSALGYRSLRLNTTGIGNTALGNQSLHSNTTGNNNIALGSSSGMYIADGTTENETGSNSIFIGAETRANADGENNQIVIGDTAIGNGSNTVTLGNDIITDTYLKGNVNITDELQVSSNVNITDDVSANNSFFNNITIYDEADIDGAVVMGSTLSVADNLTVTGEIYGSVAIVNGLVTNLASQGSGGYDFMEWTSNVTGTTQIPLWRNPSAFEIVAVTFAWMGDTALSIGAAEQVDFEIGYITNNTSAKIANFNTISNLFTIDSTYNGLFASGEVEFATPISLTKYQNLGIIGTELGTVTPNNGELSISLLLRHIP